MKGKLILMLGILLVCFVSASGDCIDGLCDGGAVYIIIDDNAAPGDSILAVNLGSNIESFELPDSYGGYLIDVNSEVTKSMLEGDAMGIFIGNGKAMIILGEGISPLVGVLATNIQEYIQFSGEMEYCITISTDELLSDDIAESFSENCDNRIKSINCSDSDGGINLYERGIVEQFNFDGTRASGTDNCQDDFYLEEQYCLYDGFVEEKIIYCPNGCINGVCNRGAVYVITDDSSTSNDDILVTALFNDKLKHYELPSSYNGYIIDDNNAVTKSMLEGDAMGIFIYDGKAMIIVGEHIPPAIYVLSMNVQNDIESREDIEYCTTISGNQLLSDNTMESFRKYCDNETENVSYNNETENVSYNNETYLPTEEDQGKNYSDDEDYINDSNFQEAENENVAPVCFGCFVNDSCYPLGYRMGDKYCSKENVFVSQLMPEFSCENNFECDSNICVNNICIDVGLWNKFISWIKKLFS